MHKPSATRRLSASRLVLEVLENRRVLSLLGPVPLALPTAGALAPAVPEPTATAPALSAPSLVSPPNAALAQPILPLLTDPGANATGAQVVAAPTTVSQTPSIVDPTLTQPAVAGADLTSLAPVTHDFLTQVLAQQPAAVLVSSIDLTGSLAVDVSIPQVVQVSVSAGVDLGGGGVTVGVDTAVHSGPSTLVSASLSADVGVTLPLSGTAPPTVGASVSTRAYISLGGDRVTVEAQSTIQGFIPGAGPVGLSAQASLVVPSAGTLLAGAGASLPGLQAKFDVSLPDPGIADPVLTALRGTGAGNTTPGNSGLHVTAVTTVSDEAPPLAISLSSEPGTSGEVEVSALRPINSAVDNGNGQTDLADAGPLHSAADLGAIGLHDVTQTEPTHGPLDISQVAVNGEPESAAQVSMADEPLAPDMVGLLGDGGADLSAIERALQHFLDQLAALPEEIGSWLARLGPLPWVLIGVAAAGAGHELVRRRRQRRLGSADAEADRAVGLRWASGLV